MRKQINLWAGRTLAIAAVAVGVQQWGLPLYRQYVTPKKTEVFVPTTKAKSGKLVISFHEIGTLEAENVVAVQPDLSGKIITLIPEGSNVKAGDKIAELDTSDIERELRDKTLAYKNMLADVDRAKAEMEILKEKNRTEIESAQAQLDFDKTEYDIAVKDLAKQNRLLEDKLVARSEVDKAELQVRAKELSVRKGEKALILKRKEVESAEQQKNADVRNRQFAAQMSKSVLDEVQRRVSGAVIKAPTDGMVVLGRYWRDGLQSFKVGDQVERRQILCQLPDLSKMKITVKVGESDAPRLKVGTPTLIRLDAVPGKVFHGTVDSISVLATETEIWQGGTPGKRQFQVKVMLEENDPKTLKPGMTADAEFICDTVSKAVYAPIEAVVEQDGKTFVFLKNGKKFKRVRVVTGKQNDNFIAVTKGLKPGEVIALRDPTRPAETQEQPEKEKSSDREKKPAPMPNSGTAKN